MEGIVSYMLTYSDTYLKLYTVITILNKELLLVTWNWMLATHLKTYNLEFRFKNRQKT